MQVFLRQEDAAGFQECTSSSDGLLYGIDPGKGPTAINGIEATALELHIAQVSHYEFDITQPRCLGMRARGGDVSRRFIQANHHAVQACDIGEVEGCEAWSTPQVEDALSFA